MKFAYVSCVLISGLLTTTVTSLSAQENSNSIEIAALKPKKFYASNALDAAILSSSLFTKPGQTNKLSTPRFSYFWNFGFNFNYDFNNSIGLYTGIGIKNIGFIEKIKDSTIKRRVYTLGVPLGIKLGNLSKRTFLFAGAGIDIPMNYREKGFVKRNNKQKFNEWFSERNNQFLPYVFVGMSFKPSMTLKLQYYFNSMMNTGFAEYPGTAVLPSYPYAGYDVRLLMISMGFDIHYNRTPKKKKAEQKNIS